MKATISLDSLWVTIQSLSLNNRKWLANKLHENIREQEEEAYISKEEILAGIRSGLEDLKAVREGKIKATSMDELIKELENENHD